MQFPEFEVEDLFPEIRQFGGYFERRSYVEERLVEMANEGEFCLTKLINQDQRVYTLIGEVILGHGIDPSGEYWGRKGHTTNAPVPPELEELLVKVAAVDGKGPISYVDGMKTVRRRKSGRQRARTNAGMQRVERVVSTPGPVATLSLRAAWLCLRELGAYCRPAEHPDDKTQLWKYVEIHDDVPRPDGVPASAPSDASKTARGGGRR